MSYIGKSTPISIIDNVSKSAGGTFGGDVTVNGTLTATSLSGDGSNLTGVESDLVFDTTPQLGGNLDLNSNDITGTGNVMIGSSTAETTISGGTPTLQVIGSGFNSYLAAVRRDTTQYASGIALVKSRNTSVGSYTIVQDNDQLGSILFIGDDGTDLDTYGATISARVNGTPGANNMPADIEFATNSGTGSPTLNLKLTKDGVLEGASDAEIKTSPIRIHSNTINTNTTVASTENAVSGGPITIASGVTVTVSGDWTVV